MQVALQSGERHFQLYSHTVLLSFFLVLVKAAEKHFIEPAVIGTEQCCTAEEERRQPKSEEKRVRKKNRPRYEYCDLIAPCCQTLRQSLSQEPVLHANTHTHTLVHARFSRSVCQSPSSKRQVSRFRDKEKII